MYKHFFKRLIDIILSGLGIVALAIPMAVVAVVIKIDSPGPVFFRQKRVGIHKSHFNIIKFRSMSTSAPKDTPTHQLSDAASYLSAWQRFIRKTSIDELPQLFNIFGGSMSIIGPRPALWNQYDLIDERDKYGANDVKPGLTGLAQISGRDELEIPLKAKLDGEYVLALNSGSVKGFSMDLRCFFKTIISVLKSDGVVEGGNSTASSAAEAESSEEVSVN